MQKPDAQRRIWFYSLVTTEGFEPSTLGAEIRYSIQLNYVAICKCKYSSSFGLRKPILLYIRYNWAEQLRTTIH